jgi:O6-methylguanine-DNA--protein-cysteine methyltransferase
MCLRVQGFERTGHSFEFIKYPIVFNHTTGGSFESMFSSAYITKQERSAAGGIVIFHPAVMATDEAEAFYTAVYDVVRLIPCGQVTTYGIAPSSLSDGKATSPS